MANTKETYEYIADPWRGRWTVSNKNGTLVIELKAGLFCVDGKTFVSITQAREYAFDKLNIPQLLPC